MLKVERIYNVTLLTKRTADGLLCSIYHRAPDDVDCIRCVCVRVENGLVLPAASSLVLIVWVLHQGIKTSVFPPKTWQPSATNCWRLRAWNCSFSEADWHADPQRHWKPQIIKSSLMWQEQKQTYQSESAWNYSLYGDDPSASPCPSKPGWNFLFL